MSQDRRLDAHRLHHAESLQRMLARAPAQRMALVLDAKLRKDGEG